MTTAVLKLIHQSILESAMKILLLAIITFVATLALTTQSTANTAAKEGHHNGLPAKMNSLYPEKQADHSRAVKPAVIEISAPAFLSNVAAGTVKLEWTSGTTVNGSVQYHVQVATDPNFKWLVANEHFVKNNMFEFTKAEAGQKYFWRVASFKGDNNSSYTKSNFVSSVFSVK